MKSLISSRRLHVFFGLTASQFLAWPFLALLGWLEFLAPQANALDTNAYGFGRTIVVQAPHHLHAILPYHFDLEGTWRLDPSPAHDPWPLGHVGKISYLSLINGAETEHYGVDTMKLKRTGYQVFDTTAAPGDTPYTNITYGPGTSVQNDCLVASPDRNSEQFVVYTYSGTLTHRVAIGCADNFTSVFDPSIRDYVYSYILQPLCFCRI